MGSHRLDRHDCDKWGGPDLVSALDGREAATHSTSERDTAPLPSAGGAPAGQSRATAEPTSGIT
jgi:hypothetical protein